MARKVAAGVQSGKRQNAALAISKTRLKVESPDNGINNMSIQPDSSQSQVEEETVNAISPRSTTQIFVSFGDLYFTLVNNSLGIPLAYLAVLSTDFRLQQQDSQELDMAGSLSLRAGK